MNKQSFCLLGRMYGGTTVYGGVKKCKFKNNQPQISRMLAITLLAAYGKLPFEQNVFLEKKTFFRNNPGA